MNRRDASLALLALAAAPQTIAGEQMNRREFPPKEGSYAQAVEIADASRLLFISGQIPVADDDRLPTDFKEQARIAWANVGRQLRDAGMSFADVVKVTIFLSDRRYRQQNYEVRNEVMGSLRPALTVIITGIYDEAWLLEIEAIAAA